jgi:hypothetical protein
MNGKSNRSAPFNACLIAAMALMTRHALAEPPKDVSKEIDDLRGAIIAAKVYALPDGVSFRVRQNAQEVVRNGCRYSAAEQADVTALLDVVVAASFHESPPQPDGYETRIVVHLYTRDGRTIPLDLTRQYNDAPVTGRYDGRVPVAAATMAFGAALGKWKAQRKPDNPASLMCQW